MINCSVTVMPVRRDSLRVGFIRRERHDTFGGKLVAPGGKIEMDDGILVDSVPYFSVEHCAKRELYEETGILVNINDLHYFCSLTLPHNGRVVISMYAFVDNKKDNSKVIWLTEEEIKSMNDDEFAPGMKYEALLLISKLKGMANGG